MSIVRVELWQLLGFTVSLIANAANMLRASGDPAPPARHAANLIPTMHKPLEVYNVRAGLEWMSSTLVLQLAQLVCWISSEYVQHSASGENQEWEFKHVWLFDSNIQ